MMSNKNNSTVSPEAESESADTQTLIPDLCQGKAVLWLILFSEALVLVLILLSSDVLRFQWGDFGMLSFYVQWVVLITAACLCRIRLHVKHLSINQMLVVSFITIMVVNLIISIMALYGLNRFIALS